MNDILLITIDSLRADHVGYHGYERDTTPTIDKFARNASCFMNTFAHVGGTQYAFPSILTGVTPMMYGGYDSVSEDQTLISEVFHDEGYRTGGIHSNLYVSEEYGYARGFDFFFDSKTEASLTGRARQYIKDHFTDSFIYPLLQRVYDSVESKGGVNIGSYHVPGDEITDMAIDFLREDETDQPTFLWVHYMDVHHPFLPPEEYQTQFLEESLSDRDCIKLRQKFTNQPEGITEEEFERFIGLYDAEIRFTDEQIKRLLAVAREELSNPTIAVTADHGEHFLERGYFSGAQLYDIKVHVPLVIDGLGTSGTYDELVGLTDLPTTLVDSAGLTIPDTFHGHSLVGLVEGEKWPRRSIMGGYRLDNPAYMYRDREWKYIERPDAIELYNLEDDPTEQQNISENNPDIVEELSGEVHKHKQLITETETDTEKIEMEEHVKERLRRLGYDE